MAVFSCGNDLGNDNQINRGKVTALLQKANKSSDDVQVHYLDSAYSYIAEFENDSISRYQLRELASEYYNLELYEKSLNLGHKIYSRSAIAGDTLSMARALYYSADSHYAMASMDSAFYYYTQAQKVYSDLNQLGTLGEIILYKAYIYYNIGEYVLCESEAFKALSLLEKQNKTAHVFNCLNLIATALDGLNNNEEAVKYYRLALKKLDDFDPEEYGLETITIYQASCYNNMGGVFVKMGKQSDAIQLYNTALALMDFNEIYPALYAKLLNNLAYAKFKSGDLSNLPELFFDSLRIRDSLNNKSGIITSNVNLGEYYAFMKDTSQSIEYLRAAYAEAKEINSHYDILNSLKLLSDIDKANSGLYYDRYINVNDSLQDIAKNNRDKFARIEYETDKLQNEKEALVKKNSFIIGVSAVVLLFIAAIFVIYYLNSKNKELMLVQEQQKANEEIYELMFEQQQKIDDARNEEKNRIAMELHDGILNNIYAVRLNLEFSNRKTDDTAIARRKEYIKELQSIESEIRGVSHDLARNSIMADATGFKEMLEFMIISQKNNFNTGFEASIDPEVKWEQLSNLVKVNVYRMIQEAMQNINKYSRASNAWVTVERTTENWIKVNVKDNGVGFDTEKARGGIGLRNMNKRAASINGRVTITSEESKGTEVALEFPYLT